ncbi:hypothetical protein [Mangrovibacterium sp.]|uniref:hypothetical protein n=1 Tax=Mangrovibacterium sp. TaxID=1961364 RepID=UPI00356ADC62
MNFNKHHIFPALVLILTFISVNQWNRIQVMNTAFYWLISLLILVTAIWYYQIIFYPKNRNNYIVVKLFLLTALIGSIRGAFIAENYWEFKQLFDGIFSLSLPLLVYPFYSPVVVGRTLRFWLKFALIPFVLIFIWSLTTVAYHFYLGPIFVLGMFVPLMRKQWQIVFIALMALMLFVDLGARSQVIKTFVVLLLSSAVYFRRSIPLNLFKIGHTFLFIFPIVLLFLGISGTFNIFEDLSSNQGKYVEKRMVNGKMVEEDIAGDTRTFIYEEVIGSALRNQYVLFGRSPARGNDSAWFGREFAEDLGTGKYERHKNEVCFPNVFTWLGITGMLLYCIIYFQSSFLAVYRSRNIYMKIIGIFIAFRFAYGWVEDFNRMDIMNVSLWMLIGIGYSEKFRNMTNLHFKLWILTNFKSPIVLNRNTFLLKKGHKSIRSQRSLSKTEMQQST